MSWDSGLYCVIQGQPQGQGQGSLFCGPNPIRIVIRTTVPHLNSKVAGPWWHPWPGVPLACLPLLAWSFYSGHCSCVSDRYSVESSIFYHSIKTAWVGPGELDWLLKALAVSRKGLPQFTSPRCWLTAFHTSSSQTPGTHLVHMQAGRQNTLKYEINL